MSRELDLKLEHMTNRSHGQDSASIIGKEITAILINNEKESVVSVIAEEMIGFGHYGNIYKSRIQYPGGKSYYMAQKIFKKSIFKRRTRDVEDNLKKHAQKTMEIYSFLKKLHFPIRNTMRIAQDKKSVFMSLGSFDSTLLLGTNISKDKDYFSHSDIALHVNVDDVYRQLEYIYNLANNNDIYITADAFFLQYDMLSQKTKVIVGDYDSIEMSSNKNKSLADKNKHEIRKCINQFIAGYDTYIDRGERRKLASEIDRRPTQ